MKTDYALKTHKLKKQANFVKLELLAQFETYLDKVKHLKAFHKLKEMVEATDCFYIYKNDGYTNKVEFYVKGKPRSYEDSLTIYVKGFSIPEIISAVKEERTRLEKDKEPCEGLSKYRIPQMIEQNIPSLLSAKDFLAWKNATIETFKEAIADLGSINFTDVEHKEY